MAYIEIRYVSSPLLPSLSDDYAFETYYACYLVCIILRAMEDLADVV